MYIEVFLGVKVSEHRLIYNTPFEMYIGFSIVFLRHQYYRSLAILIMGSSGGLKMVDELHSVETGGFYIGHDDTPEIENGIKLQQRYSTLIITSYVDLSTSENTLLVSSINFGT